ncbi:hypothetical protein ACWF94_16795 [Streptomyces sp. NPDC055078]
MGRGVRRPVAGVVTVVAFAVPAVVCGVWELRSLIDDAGGAGTGDHLNGGPRP